MGKLQTIADPAEDRALMAVRLHRQGAEAGYDASATKMLVQAGLSEYSRASMRTVVVTMPEARLTGLTELLANLTIAQGRTGTPRYIADAAYNVIDRWRTDLYHAIERGEIGYEVPEPQAPQFDAEDLIARYGYTGAMPRPRGEHAEAIEAERQRLTTLWVDVAVADGLCGEFERRVTIAGLGKYLPAVEHEVTAEVPGHGEMTIRVRSDDRRGRVEPYAIIQGFQRAVADKLAADIQRWVTEAGDTLIGAAKPLPRNA